jgi:hypothetical protein
VVAGYDELDRRVDGLEHGNGRAEFVQLGLFGDVSAVDGDVCGASPWESESTRTLVEMESILSRLLDAGDVLRARLLWS